jgi:hypothetical protein
MSWCDDFTFPCHFPDVLLIFLLQIVSICFLALVYGGVIIGGAFIIKYFGTLVLQVLLLFVLKCWENNV